MEILDNCSSCHEVSSDSSMNVIEIDGASNNSENIRDLINNIHYLPTRGDYKVYIIDEVHMLSVSAFNACQDLGGTTKAYHFSKSDNRA